MGDNFEINEMVLNTNPRSVLDSILFVKLENVPGFTFSLTPSLRESTLLFVGRLWMFLQPVVVAEKIASV